MLAAGCLTTGSCTCGRFCVLSSEASKNFGGFRATRLEPAGMGLRGRTVARPRCLGATRSRRLRPDAPPPATPRANRPAAARLRQTASSSEKASVHADMPRSKPGARARCEHGAGPLGGARGRVPMCASDRAACRQRGLPWGPRGLGGLVIPSGARNPWYPGRGAEPLAGTPRIPRFARNDTVSGAESPRPAPHDAEYRGSVA
jgi:hypothetical protein